MPSLDFAQNPFLVIWECTRACGLGCRHCRANARPHRDPGELTTLQAKQMIAEIAAMQTPLFVISGGDPLQRDDLNELVYHAAALGLHPAITASATPLVTQERICQLKEAGLAQWAFSLDGSNASIHDHFRGRKGCFDLTMQCIQWLHESDIPVQINTTLTRHNLNDLPNLYDLIQRLAVVRWEVFTLVPMGRAHSSDQLTPQEHEAVMRWLATQSETAPFAITSTEGPQFRWFKAERSPSARGVFSEPGTSGLRGNPLPMWDGNGFLFISWSGEVFPSGFLPLSMGNVTKEPIVKIYRDAPGLRALRNPDGFHGKCGQCRLRSFCGGSRALAYAASGDMLGSDPLCTLSF